MKNSFQNIMKGIAHFQVKNPILTIMIILAITVTLYGGVSKVKTVASLEQMMPPDISEIKAFNELRDNYMGQDMIAIVLVVNPTSSDPNGIMDIRDKEVFEYTQHLKDLISQEPDVIQTYAASDVILYAAQNMGMEIQTLENSQLTQEQYNLMFQNEQVKSQLSNFINEDYTTAIIMITTDVSADDDRMKLLASKIKTNVESAGVPKGISIKFTGTPIIQQKLGVLIAQDRKVTQNISTLFVFLITALLFGTFTSAIVPIIIVTISVYWLYGIMGYAGLPISTLAGGVAAMVIGIGIDYAIHLMNKFKNERKKGKSVEYSVEKAIQETGTALTGSAIATILAFLAFLFGNMPEMNRFGLLMAIGVGSAFILSITALPALLIIEEKIIHAISRKLRFGIDGEYVLYEKDEVHPDTHEIAEICAQDMETILDKYKVVKPRTTKNQVKSKIIRK